MLLFGFALASGLLLVPTQETRTLKKEGIKPIDDVTKEKAVAAKDAMEKEGGPLTKLQALKELAEGVVVTQDELRDVTKALQTPLAHVLGEDLAESIVTSLENYESRALGKKGSLSLRNVEGVVEKVQDLVQQLTDDANVSPEKRADVLVGFLEKNGLAESFSWIFKNDETVHTAMDVLKDFAEDGDIDNPGNLLKVVSDIRFGLVGDKVFGLAKGSRELLLEYGQDLYAVYFLVQSIRGMGGKSGSSASTVGEPTHRLVRGTQYAHAFYRLAARGPAVLRTLRRADATFGGAINSTLDRTSTYLTGKPLQKGTKTILRRTIKGLTYLTGTGVGAYLANAAYSSTPSAPKP